MAGVSKNTCTQGSCQTNNVQQQVYQQPITQQSMALTQCQEFRGNYGCPPPGVLNNYLNHSNVQSQAIPYPQPVAPKVGLSPTQPISTLDDKGNIIVTINNAHESKIALGIRRSDGRSYTDNQFTTLRGQNNNYFKTTNVADYFQMDATHSNETSNVVIKFPPGVSAINIKLGDVTHTIRRSEIENELNKIKQNSNQQSIVQNNNKSVSPSSDNDVKSTNDKSKTENDTQIKPPDSSQVVPRSSQTPSASQVASSSVKPPDPSQVVPRSSQTPSATQVASSAATSPDPSQVVPRSSQTPSASQVASSAATSPDSSQVVPRSSQTPSASQVTISTANLLDSSQVTNNATQAPNSSQVFQSNARLEAVALAQEVYSKEKTITPNNREVFDRIYGSQTTDNLIRLQDIESSFGFKRGKIDQYMTDLQNRNQINSVINAWSEITNNKNEPPTNVFLKRIEEIRRSWF